MPNFMIKLTINRGQNVVLLDDEDYEKISKFSWRVHPQSNNIQRSEWIKGSRGKVKTFSMASEIMNDSGGMYDHQDRNPFNNQKSNLCKTTYQKNLRNRNKRKNSSSKYFGVSFFKRDRTWQAAITINYKVIHIGRYSAELEAAVAYNKAAINLVQGFINLNKDDQGNVLC